MGDLIAKGIIIPAVRHCEFLIDNLRVKFIYHLSSTYPSHLVNDLLKDTIAWSFPSTWGMRKEIIIDQMQVTLGSPTLCFY